MSDKGTWVGGRQPQKTLGGGNPATEEKQDAIIAAIGAIPGGGGIQYTEGDTDTSITGTAMMFEDTSNVLVVPSASKPLPVSATGDVDVLTLPLESRTATAVDATASGDTTIVSITNTPRLYYISLSANGANSADVTAVVKVGASAKYKVSLKAGSIWARNIGSGRAYISGSTGDDIVVNLSAAQTVHVSVEYADV